MNSCVSALPSVCLLGGGEREERGKESGGMMDSYDVRKAITVLILVCTEYVGLYRDWCPILFLSSSSSLRALFGILDFSHQPLTLERGVSGTIRTLSQTFVLRKGEPGKEGP
jgi:hypothetical protein